MSSYAQRLTNMAARLDDDTSAFLADLESLDDAQLTFRPAPDCWSVLDVGHHLLLVERNTLIRLRKPRRDTRRGLRHRLVHQALRFVLRAGIRVKTPSQVVQPTDPITLPELKEQWPVERAGIREVLLAAEEGDPLMRHPVAGPMDAVAGFEFLVLHLNHHRKQVARIRRSEGFP